MKIKIGILLLLISNLVLAQRSGKYILGTISQEDKEIKTYNADPTANALFLFENGATKFKNGRNGIIISTTYYAKIKIFKKEGFKHATVKIPIYKNKQKAEKVRKVKAFTHNNGNRTSLRDEDVFTDIVTENWSEVRFTLPDIQENSIIEYEYTLESPFWFNFTGWAFQEEIPKLYSRFHALIPGNFKYNRRLMGTKKLSLNDATIRPSCFSIQGVSMAECEELTYVMEDIPAFIEEEYMTSQKNYISLIKFELSEAVGFDGRKHRYTKSWNSVDQDFKTDESSGRQLRKKEYLRKQLPADLTNGSNNLEKAKRIYSYIKNHFTWNDINRITSGVDVKKAFEKKIGNSTEINIALINALNANGFDAEIMYLSTRNNGLPTKLHPVMSDFNYAIAKLNLEGKSYLLDATNKKMPFGMLPFRALNGYGRVMNFEKGSYWFDIKARKTNLTRVSMSLKLNDEGDFEGSMHKYYMGYVGLYKREEINETNEDSYVSDIEDAYPNLLIDAYKNTNLENVELNLSELFKIKIESGLEKDLILLNPFFDTKLSENPFQLKERTYPVDFGYPRIFQFTLKLTIPKGYSITELPENVGIKLPNNGGNYTFSIAEKDGILNLNSKYDIGRSYFTPDEYPFLKEFYNQIIKTQKSLITLEKIKN